VGRIGVGRSRAPCLTPCSLRGRTTTPITRRLRPRPPRGGAAAARAMRAPRPPAPRARRRPPTRPRRGAAQRCRAGQAAAGASAGHCAARRARGRRCWAKTRRQRARQPQAGVGASLLGMLSCRRSMGAPPAPGLVGGGGAAPRSVRAGGLGCPGEKGGCWRTAAASLRGARAAVRRAPLARQAACMHVPQLSGNVVQSTCCLRIVSAGSGAGPWHRAVLLFVVMSCGGHGHVPPRCSRCSACSPGRALQRGRAEPLRQVGGGLTWQAALLPGSPAMRGRGQAPGRAHCWRWGTCPTTSPLSGPPSVSPADGARSQRGHGRAGPGPRRCLALLLGVWPGGIWAALHGTHDAHYVALGALSIAARLSGRSFAWLWRAAGTNVGDERGARLACRRC